VLADREMRARITDLGETVLGGSPADFGKRIAEETEKWERWSSSPAPERTEPSSKATSIR
jgi:hypothetical protein